MTTGYNAVTATRPVSLSREGSTLRLAFSYNPALVERAQQLPYAAFDQETKTWTAQLCAQSVDQLRTWYQAGLTDVSIDTLLTPGEEVAPVSPAVLRPGSLRRPYQVSLAMRDDRIYARLRAIPGATWVRESKSISYPPSAAAAIAELVEKGVVADPEKIITAAAVTVSFDSRTGRFVVRGDERAERSFNKNFPASDVVGAWMEKGLDVGFSDSFTEEVYRGELARAGEGVQPEGLRATLWPYQAQSVAVALERTGFGVFHEMGLGKALAAETPVLTPQGFLPIGALQIGNEVIGANGLPTRVLGVYPQGVRPLFTVTFSDGATTICDPEHLWTVTDFETTEQRTLTLTLAEIIEAGLATASGLRFAIPTVAPVHFAPLTLHVIESLPALAPLDVRLAELAELLTRSLVLVETPSGLQARLRLTPAMQESNLDLIRSLGGIATPLPTSATSRFVDPYFQVALPLEVRRLLELHGVSAVTIETLSDAPRRFIASIEPAAPDEAVCIKVDAHDELFVIEGYVVTHNTVIAIAAGHELMFNRHEVPRTVVVVPGSVRTQWKNEIERFSDGKVVVIDGDLKRRKALYEEAKDAQWMVVNYDLLSRDYALIAPLVAGAFLVADEAHRCFPAGTTVMTDRGPLDIQEIVDNQQTVNVLAWDEAKRTTAFRPVTAWMKSPTPQVLIRITHREGELVCTPSHPIWTEERGYVPASEVRPGETLRRVPQGDWLTDSPQSEVLLGSVSRPKEQPDPSTDSSSVCALSHDIFDQTTRERYRALLLEESRPAGEPTSSGSQGTSEKLLPTSLSVAEMGVRGLSAPGDAPRQGRPGAVLQQVVLGEATNGAIPRAQRESADQCSTSTPRTEASTTGYCREDESEQPNVRSQSARQDGQVKQWQDLPVAWGQRSADCASTHPASRFELSTDRVPDSHSPSSGQVPVTAPLLQGGPGVTEGATGDRGGWAFAPVEEVAVLGPSQGVGSCCTRVDRVEIFERTSDERYGLGRGGDFVYNIEVAELNSYVADGVVVHNCKNPTSKRTKAMRQLATRASRRLALTGTPIQNDPGEWYSIISGIVTPGAFGSPQDFLNRYAYPSRFGGYEGARNLGELRERSATYYIRNVKAEVATHLPPLRVQHRPLDVDPTYRAALVRAHREARDEIKQAALAAANAVGKTGHVLDGQDVEEVETGAEMTAVGMLRLLCSSPRIVETSDSTAAQALIDAGLLPDADGPKLDELRTIAGELQEDGHRVVVFTFSKRMANLIAERLTEDGVRHVLFTGDTNSKDRDAAVAAFTAEPTPGNPGPTVFVATDAGGEGLNLGRHCSLLINMDIPWTPGVLAQRSARIHRLDGTHEKYLVINFTLKGTIEEGILRMIERKADLQDAIFGEGGGRSRTTGRGGRSFFDEAMIEWDQANQ